MKRIKQLDALRTLAIFMVLSFHFGHMTNSPVIFRQIGWSGVDLFFILSGFLISGLLFREYKFSGHIRVGHFLAKRSMKLYPAYYVLVLGSIAIAMYFGSPYKWNAIWPSIVFVQNYVLSDGIWYHLWSMAVEEHFYILLPVAFWLATKHSKNPFGKLPHVTGGVIVFCLIGRCVLPLHLGYSHLRFDGLAFGVLIAYLWEFRPEVINQVIRSRGRWLLGATLLLLSPQFVLPITNPFMYTVGLTATFLGYGGLLIYSVKCVKHNRVIEYLARIGAYSYTIYLVHAPVLMWTLHHGYSVDRIGVAFCSYISLSIVLGVLFAKLLTIPASLWKRESQTNSIPDVSILTLAA